MLVIVIGDSDQSTHTQFITHTRNFIHDIWRKETRLPGFCIDDTSNSTRGIEDGNTEFGLRSKYRRDAEKKHETLYECRLALHNPLTSNKQCV